MTNDKNEGSEIKTPVGNWVDDGSGNTQNPFVPPQGGNLQREIVVQPKIDQRIMIPGFDVSGLLSPQIPHSQVLCQSLITNGISWDASPMGTGKTASACAIIRHLKKKFIVVCPKAAITIWNKTLPEFGLKAELIINYEKIARRTTKFYKKITVNNYCKLHGILDKTKVDAHMLGQWKIPNDWIIVFDEFHKTRGLETRNSSLLINAKKQNLMTHCISGTAAMTPLDMRALGFILGYHDCSLKQFKIWCKSVGCVPLGKWGVLLFDSNDPAMVEKFKVVHHDLFDKRKIASKMDRKDFGDIFPKNQIICDAYDMGDNSKKIRQAYDDMETELIRLEESCKNYKEHVLAILIRTLRICEMLKITTIEEMCADSFNEGRSTLVFLNYRDSIETLVNRLSKKYGEKLIGQVHGGRTPGQRNKDVELFQSDDKRFLINTTSAGGESLNAQDITGKYPRTSLINPSFKALSVIQAIGRHERAYAMSDCITRMVLAAGTQENSVADRFNSKKAGLDILVNGDLIPDGKCFGILNKVVSTI